MAVATTSIQVRVLGDVRVVDPSADAALGRGQAREVLAYLVGRGDTPAPTASIIDALWDDPPATAATIVHGHVRRIRSALGPAAVALEAGGYRLDLEPGAVDLWQLDAAVQDGDHRRARSLWAEPLFGPYASRPWARAARSDRIHLRGLADGSATGLQPRRAFQNSRLIGRRQELRSVLSAIERHRLVIIVGLGGVGKSRLALEAASTGHHAATVDLGSAAGPAISRVAGDLGLTATGEPAWDLRSVASAIGTRELLVVLDGCEHDAAGAATVIGELLAACPRLRFLATSRVALGMPGEHVVPLVPFADPGDPYGDAVDLLLDRFAAFGLSPDAVDRSALAAIGERTAGVPLAIELSVADAVLSDPSRGEPSARTDPFRESRPSPAHALDQIVASTFDRLTDGSAAVLHRIARLVYGFTPSMLAELTRPGDSPQGVLYELHANGLLSSAPPNPGHRLRLLDPVRSSLLARPDDGALIAVSEAVAAVLGRVRPDLTRPIDLGAVAAATAELPNAEALLPELLDAGRATDALRLVRAGADGWAEAGRWARGSAVIGDLLAAVHPEPHPAPTPLDDETAAGVPVDPIDWAGAVWAKALVAPTFAASSQDYAVRVQAAEVVRGVVPAMEAQLQFLLTLGAGYRGDGAGADRHLRRFRELAEELDSDYGRMMAAQVDALGRFAAGDAGAAASLLASTADRALAIGAVADAARIRRLGAMARRTAGDPEGALVELRRAEDLASEAGSVGSLATIRTDIVDLGHRRGDLDRATVVRALDAVVGVGNLRSAGMIRLRLGTLDDDPATIATAALDLLESDRAWASVAIAELLERLPRVSPLRRIGPTAVRLLGEDGGSPLGDEERAIIARVTADTPMPEGPAADVLDDHDLRSELRTIAAT